MKTSLTLASRLFALSLLLGLTASAQHNPRPAADETGVPAHRHFLEVDRPGEVYSILRLPDQQAFVRLVEIDSHGTSISDTLRVWVQHFDGKGEIAKQAREADLIIACHRPFMARYAQAKHVLPESRGKIHFYMLKPGLITISERPISYYDLLLAHNEKQLAVASSR